jgi:pyrimidine oxygenase
MDDGVSNFSGKFYEMDDCVLSPRPAGGSVPIVAAGQSERGMKFSAEYADYNFVMGSGVNTPSAFAGTVTALAAAAETTGRDVGAMALFMIIADETDEAAQAKWDDYNANADVDALGFMVEQTETDTTADENSTAKTISLPEGAVNLNMGTLVGSYETVAGMLDEVAAIKGVKGIMLVFDDFVAGVENFGSRIQPLLECRKTVVSAG